MSFKTEEGKFGDFNTIRLMDESTGSYAEIALRGATLLNLFMPAGKGVYNIIDGFADEEEIKEARGARSWLMIPFANRIPDGIYSFKGKEYQLKPVGTRTQVIHGFASYLDYEIIKNTSDNKMAEVVLGLKEIRPGVYDGYPFSLDISVMFTFSDKSLSIKVKAENVGNEPAPFATGWHPYFKTNDEGIEDLVFTLNAGQVIRLNENYIPLPGESAYADIKNFPEKNFNDYLPVESRKINNRKLDDCYADLERDKNGYSVCSLADPQKGIEIQMFQRGGVTLAFSGDSLQKRKRKSVALEPMQYLTNAFNREEFANSIAINPGENSVFEFGVRVVES